MNLPSRKDSRGRNEKDRGFKSRLELDDKIYNSASEALEAYITQFEGGRTSNFYRRRPSDLLSPAPKFYFMDSVERSLRSPPSKTPARKVEELLEWVNSTYSKELSSKVQPFGYRTTPDVTGSDEENMNPHSRSVRHSYRGNDGDLSTLPSPSSSVVDLDSNTGTVETEVLLSSYKGVHPSGSFSGAGQYRSPPLSRSGRTHVRPDGSTEYPSWVSGLGKEYPSWVEDLDITAQHRRLKKSPGQRYSTETSSSETDSKRKHHSLRSSRSTPALKVSDLHSRASTHSIRSKEPPRRKMAEKRETEVDWNDGSSTDTEMLVSQPLYGVHPVNMGGDLHNSLYEDNRVAQLKKESTRKLRKSTGKAKSREYATVSPRRSKSLSFTPTKTLRFSDHPHEEPREYTDSREATSGGMKGLRDPFPMERSPFTVLPSRYNLPPQSDRYGSPEEFGRRSASPQLSRMFVSPPAVTRYPFPESKKPESRTPPRSHSRLSSGSKTPMSARRGLQIEIPSRDEETDADSKDTDRVMRKSPTGIKMEKMYRDPSTMYPWKSMMQSSWPGEVSIEHAGAKPVYRSTPMVYSSRDPQKSQSFVGKDSYRDRGSLHRQLSAHRVTVRDHRDQYDVGYGSRSVQDIRSTPRKVFASSSFRSRDNRLANSAPDTRHQKPPPAPRNSSRRFTHRRSKTVPDLRRIAMSSAGRPRALRRSLDDDIISVNTADTEALITHPPMPMFDVSPSLTTVSDSDTVVESEAETEMVMTKRGQMRTRLTAPDTVRVDEDGFSPTSVFASTNPHAAVREELPQRFHLWKLDDDTKASDSFIKKRFTSPKSGIISTFLEGCLNVNNGDEKVSNLDTSSPVARLSGKEAAPGPVEALKQMLFTMQDMAHHDTQHENGHSDFYKLPSKFDFKSRDSKDFASDDQSDKDLDILRGEVSLQRAYHHLERLKRLVGREDDRSSVSSTS